MLVQNAARLPECKYGADCYQQNADHQRKFHHPPPAASTASKQTKSNTDRQNGISVASTDTQVADDCLHPVNWIYMRQEMMGFGDAVASAGPYVDNLHLI